MAVQTKVWFFFITKKINQTNQMQSSPGKGEKNPFADSGKPILGEVSYHSRMFFKFFPPFEPIRSVWTITKNRARNKKKKETLTNTSKKQIRENEYTVHS